MTGFIMKLLLAPLAVLAVSILSGQVEYSSIYQPIIVGLIIAAVGHMMELLVLRRGTAWLSTVLDFAAAAGIAYYSQMFFTNAYVSLWGAVITGAVIAITEHMQHRFLVGGGFTRK